MPRPRIPAVLLALLVPACSVPGDGDTDSGDDSTEYGASSLPTGGAGCLVADDCPPADPCQLLACEDGACVYTPREAGELVDDVAGDCASLVCDGDGAANSQSDPDDRPDDGVACTEDVCDGGPQNLPLPPGSACDATFVCHADLTCQPCPERTGCADDSLAEPNETQGDAAALPTVRDDADPAYLCEALGSQGDVDWFVFTTIDTTLGEVAPAVDPTPGDPLVCMYLQCQAGGTNVGCPDGTAPAIAPLGQQGCCGHAPFSPTIDCNGFDEDATVWLQVRHDSESPPACLHYQLGYAY